MKYSKRIQLHDLVCILYVIECLSVRTRTWKKRNSGKHSCNDIKNRCKNVVRSEFEFVTENKIYNIYGC